MAGGAKRFRHQQRRAFALGGSDARVGYLAFLVDGHHHFHSHFRLNLRFQMGGNIERDQGANEWLRCSRRYGFDHGFRAGRASAFCVVEVEGVGIEAVAIEGRAGAGGALSFTVGNISTAAYRTH